MELAPHIVVDPKIRFGQPVVRGTRVTVDEVLGFVKAGITYEDIELEYGLTKRDVLAAINYASSFVTGERVKPLKPARV